MTTSVTPAAETTTNGAPRMTSLVRTAQVLVAGDKGLLAIDESIPTCNKRFARLGITPDKQTRRVHPDRHRRLARDYHRATTADPRPPPFRAGGCPS